LQYGEKNSLRYYIDIEDIFSAPCNFHVEPTLSVISSMWIRLSFMSGCPLKNPCGFYIVYLRGNDVDFTRYFRQDGTISSPTTVSSI